MAYKISAQTRLNLILAAGELFAEKGIEGVSTREIARKAGTVQNAILYHFKGVHGLIEAVRAYVVAEWKPESFLDFMQTLPTDIENCPPQERAVFTVECIRRLFKIIYMPERPLWISRYLVRCAMTEDGKEYIVSMISGKIVPAMNELFQKISGQTDPDSARCWSLRILAAPMVFTANLTEFARFREGSVVNNKLYRTLEEITIRDALFAAGLPAAPQEKE